MFISFLADKPLVGRRYTLVISFTVAGGTMLASVLTVSPGLRLVLCMVGKAGMFAAFTTAYVTTSEVFPTVIRASGLGSCNISGRLGGLLAPLMVNLPIDRTC